MKIKGIIFLLFFAITTQFYGQTPGLIIKPAGSGANPLDPDGDGYVSQKTNGIQLGFTIPPDNDVTQSEIPYVAIIRPDPLGDLLRGPTGSFSEIVGVDAAGNNAILTYNDGTNFLVRFRLGGYAPNSKSYTLFIDTDGKFGFTGPNADPNAIVGNPGFEAEISLHTNFNVVAYDVDGTTTGTIRASVAYETNCQKSVAVSTAGGDPDYFYDFYLPFSSLSSLFTSSTPLRIVAVTVMNPNAAMGNNALSDVGGVTTGTNIDAIFEDLIEAQTPTIPGAEVLDRSNCPTISGPINTGATSITVTSLHGVGTVIKVYINNTYITQATIVTGTSVTIAGLTLTGGMAVSATATASGMGESVRTCNTTFVGASCTDRPIFVTLLPANKGVECNVIAPIGTVVTLYGPNSDIETVILKNGVPDDNNPFTTTLLNQTAVQIKGGTGQALIDGSYYLTAQAPSSCVSQRTYFVVGTCAATSATPAINTTTPYTSTVTGTGGVSGATLFLYANGVLIREKTLTSTGTWSMLVDPTLICNTTLTAQQVESGKCISALSASVVVGQNTTSAPTINVNTCSSLIMTIAGFSGETDGTTINVYVNAGLVGTTTVSSGAWSVTASASTGQSITATATNSSQCKTVSASSAAVSLTGTTALTGTFSISSPVYDTTPVPVNYSGLTLSISYTINLQIDGYTIGTTTFTSSGAGTVNISPTYSGDLYIGGALGITLKSGSQCESSPYNLSTTVQCQTPSFATSVISATATDACVQTSGAFTLTNSQSLVIYTPVDLSGTTQGYSTLGNGGTITLYTYPFSIETVSTFYVKAERITAGSCEAQSTGSVTFNSFDHPTFTTQPADQTVCSGDAASIPIAWTGIGPYNLQWQYNNGGGFMNLSNSGIYSQAVVSSTSSTTSALLISNVAGLDGYSYQCIITDLGVPTDCRNTTSNSSVFTVDLVTISSSTITNSTSGSNGAIDITASGGDGNFSYDWHHIDGTGDFDDIEDLTGLAGGTYTVTVRDGNLCTYEESFTVGGIGSINLATIYSNNISCYGANDGNFKVRASTGTPPYTFSKDNFATSQTDSVFSGLASGTYTVKAKDSNLATSNSVSIIITEPLEMVVYATISNPSVVLTDGSIYANIIGGTANFNISLYKVGPPDVLITSLTNSSSRTPSFTGLSAGTYYINVTDANSCPASKLNIILTNPSVSSSSCSYVASHSFNSPSNNNYSGYDGTYNFFNTNWVETGDANNRIDIVGDALAFGSLSLAVITLTTSPYIIRTIDLTGAVLSNSTPVVSFNYALYRTVTNKDDYGVRLFVNNAALPAADFQISGATLNPGTITLNDASPNVDFINGINTFKFELYDILWGKYESASNFRIDDFTINFSKNLNTGTVTTPATCSDGTIDLSVSGGYTPYTYDWSNVGTPGVYTDSQDQTGLAAATYTAYVKDNRGCTSTQISATVASAPLTASISGVNPTCAGGGNNGSITATLTANGGGGPYTYKLIKNVTDTIATATSAATFKTFPNIGEGAYTVKIWQATGGCNTITSTQTLTLPSVSAVLASTGATTFCKGDSTTVKVTITGGTSPYIVVLANGLKTVNNYTSDTDFYIKPTSSTTASISSVTGAQSCVSTSNSGTVAITVNPLPVAPTTATVNRNNLCESDAGNISLSVTGGSGTTLRWFTGSCGGTDIGTGNNLVVAAPLTTTTTYYVRYENSCGVTTCASVTVTVNPLPSALISNGDKQICFGAATPQLEVIPVGGIVADWYNAATNGTLMQSGSNGFTPTDVNPGTYTYYAEARNTTTGCVSSSRTAVTLTIFSLPTPGLNSSDADNSICVGESVTFTGSGGINYTFYLNVIGLQGPSINDTYTITTLSNGDEVTVLVTDSNGCPATSAVITTTVIVCINITLQPSNQTTCAGSNALFTIESDGTTWQWQFYNTGTTLWENLTNDASYSGVTTAELTVIAPGTGMDGYEYRCVVGDGTATVDSDPATLTVNPLPANSYTVSDPTICLGATATINVSGSEIDVEYQLHLEADDTPVGSAISGTGNAISFDVSPAETTTYYIVANNTTTNCNMELTDLAEVTVIDVDVLVTLISVNNDCPELESTKGFNPENGSYDAGATEVRFEVTLLNSSATNWKFDYNIASAVVRPALPPSPDPQSATEVAVSGATKLLIFYIDNVPGTELDPEIEVTSVTDIDNSCTNAISKKASVNIKAMPEVGEFD